MMKALSVRCPSLFLKVTVVTSFPAADRVVSNMAGLFGTRRVAERLRHQRPRLAYRMLSSGTHICH